MKLNQIFVHYIFCLLQFFSMFFQISTDENSPPNFDCVPKGGQCIHSDEGEQCSNGMLTFYNCRPSGGGQCCKFGLNTPSSLLSTFKKIGI